ncbi:hypothetical protein SAMN05216215_106742 [Saccharopolyspora shandongensis]|uniref:Uncharacterized protein n=1 Tax=Saccharopolyspora shandongensis TaxID=418495 RepID=A0A1H3SNQ1_9PSEU|nr:hypothetical protein SAMN05216215_106742 [Saccharopolyspora shandongensis]
MVFTGLAPAWGGFGGFSGRCFSRRFCSRRFISINNGCFW